ncbi:MAG TPA: hypothetical protein VK718_05830 [Ferruginibacter sp.]|jgi:hypothetical protein|nr:hypothetical protein [Ferruginibacter sp.]
MINFHEIRIGDYVIADNDGDKKQGEVTDLNGDEKQVCVDTGQAFWYELDQLSGIPLDEKQLINLRFEKQLNADGSIKYMKGAFRILLHAKDNFTTFEIWYRDERRHITSPLFVHNLQNHFLEMTKVHLNDEAYA